MASLDHLIRENINPFDPATFKPGNFWREKQDQSQDVASIHAHVVDGIEQTLNDMQRDHKTRTVMLLGDSGSGKSHLLGRIKRQLNDRACFAYVSPWPDHQFIWRHVLRQTVDSLMEVPEGQTESQLLRWLNGLEIFKRDGFAQRIMGTRSLFVRDMSASFPAVYQGRAFFGVLYALLNPDLQMIATDWLRGEDLGEEDLKRLRVRRSIDSEDAAQKMLSNLGWVADSTQPIVICFDNLDNVPAMPNGKSGLRAMFNVNTTFQNEKLKNFLVLISLIQSNWKTNKKDIEHADLARIDQTLTLRDINLDQAAGIWAARLRPIHSQASPSPTSPIAPLTKEWLTHKHPGGRVAPRSALILAEQLIGEFKRTGKLPEIPAKSVIDDKTGEVQPEPVVPSSPESDRASFELIWQKEFDGVGKHLRRISQFSSPDLIRRLQEALEALEIPKIQRAILNSNAYCSYSLGHEHSERVCIVWTEDSNLRSFYDVMKACEKMDKARVRDRIYLIRQGKLGTEKNKGYQLFQKLFAGQNCHIEPDKESVQYLETYHRLVNAAAGGELVIGSQTPNVEKLQSFVQETGILSKCKLLQQLGIVKLDDPVVPPPIDPIDKDRKPSPRDIAAAERYILNLMTTQSLIGMQVLVENTQEQVPAFEADDAVQLIHSLCDANRLQMLDPNAKPENQLLCWIPS